MKILQVSNKYPFPANDGGAIAILNMAKGLARAGHDVSLLAMRTPKHGGKNSYDRDPSFYHEIITTFVDTTIRPVKLLRNMFFSDLPYNAERFLDPAFGEKLSGILQQQNFDIVQLEGLYLMPYAATIRSYSGAKIVLRSHNIEHEVWKRIAHQEKNILKRFFYKNLAKRMTAFEYAFINAYDMLVTISERDLHFFSGHGNTKPCLVIPVGIDRRENMVMACSPENKKLFFIGALDYIPNQEGLVWFIETVWKKFLLPCRQFTFSVAGRNAPARLKKYLANQSLNFVGEVDDAAQFMRSGGVMVVPLLSGGGIRVKIIEAMAMGIPVISTSIGAEGLDVTNGMDIIIADEPAFFSEAIIKLLENQTFFANIGKNARSFIEERMNDKNLTDKLLSFYRNNL